MAKFNVGDKVRVKEHGVAGLKIGTKAEVVEVGATGVYLDALNCVGARSWYRFGSVAKVLTKKQRIKALESEVNGLMTTVAELKARVEALEKVQAQPAGRTPLKVGDIVRIIDAKGIDCNDDGRYWRLGDIAEIVGEDKTDWHVSYNDIVGRYFYIRKETEEHCVEKVVSE